MRLEEPLVVRTPPQTRDGARCDLRDLPKHGIIQTHKGFIGKVGAPHFSCYQKG